MRNKYLNPCQRTKKKKKKKKKAEQHDGNGDTNCKWCCWNGLQRRLEELEIRGRIEPIETTTLLRSAKILGRIQETLGDLQSLRLQ